ncbi:MAG: hypothetical protein IPI52_00560 [Bacteroidetes bacterium]|nr:hypothetical protein [Bacteroidota bacterium]
MIFAETPSNPGLESIDLEFLWNLGKKHNILVNVNGVLRRHVCKHQSCVCRPNYAQCLKFIDGRGV